MEQKKNPFRFTILFNQRDPVHREAAEILNSKGRTVADYIAKALYFQHHNTPEGSETGQIEHIRTLLEQILTEREQKIGRQTDKSAPSPPARAPQSLPKKPAQPGNSEESEWSGEELSEIAGFLTTIRV